MAGLKVLITIILSCFLLYMNVDYQSKPSIECNTNKNKVVCTTNIEGYNSYAKNEVLIYKEDKLTRKEVTYKDAVGSRTSFEKYVYNDKETTLEHYEYYLNDKVKIKQVFRIDSNGKQLVSYKTYKKDTIKEKSKEEKRLDALNEDLTKDIGLMILEYVNRERGKLNLNKLSFNNKLNNAAVIRAYEQKKSFSHTRPNNQPFYSVIQEQDYRYTKSGENLVERTQSDYVKKKFSQKDKEAIALAMYNNWYSSKGHRKNMLNKDFKEIGIAIYTEGDGTIYGVQLFGTR